MELIETSNIPKEQAIREAAVHVMDSIGSDLVVGTKPELRRIGESDGQYIVPVIAKIELGEISISAKTGEVRRSPTREEIAELKKKIGRIVSRFSSRMPAQAA